MILQNKDITIGFVTSPREFPTYNESIQSIREAGFTTLIYVFAEPGEYYFKDNNLKIIQHEEKLGCFKNHNFALEYLKNNANTKFIWLFQDDGLLTKNINSLMNFLSSLDIKQIGYVNPYTGYNTARKLKISKNNQEWYESHLGWDSWGVCYIIPTQQLELLLNHPFYINHLLNYKKNQQVDACISQSFREMNLLRYYHNPSLVDHISTTSTIGHDKSLSKLKGFNFKE